MAIRMSWKEAVAKGWVRGKEPTSQTPTGQRLHQLKKFNTPEERLVAAVTARYPTAVRNYRCLPPRRFTLDVAVPEIKLALECDGFAHHGKFLADFHRDREKRNLLELAGWIVLAFPARDINRSIEDVMAMVDKAAHRQLTILAATEKTESS